MVTMNVPSTNHQGFLLKPTSSIKILDDWNINHTSEKLISRQFTVYDMSLNSDLRLLSKPARALRVEPPQVLDLPGEIRNLIYKYTLHHDDGLVGEIFTTLSAGIMKRGKFSVTCPNSLKHVCRQLYQETRTLSLKHNDTFSFLGSGKSAGLKTFTSFEPMLKSSACQNLRKVKISPDALRAMGQYTYAEMLLDTFVSKRFARIEAFCQQHPLVQVQICYPHAPGSWRAQYYTHSRLSATMRCTRGLPTLSDPPTIPGGDPFSVEMFEYRLSLYNYLEEMILSNVAFLFHFDVHDARYERRPPNNLRILLSADVPHLPL